MPGMRRACVESTLLAQRARVRWRIRVYNILASTISVNFWQVGSLTALISPNGFHVCGIRYTQFTLVSDDK